MSETVTRSYVAEGDVALKIIAEMREHNDRMKAAADAIKDELGAESVWFGSSDGRIKGFKFPNGATRKGFKEVRDGVKYPTQTTKEGKALVKRIEEIRRQTATSIVQSIEEFSAHWGHVVGSCISFPAGVFLPYKDAPKILAKMDTDAESEAKTPAGWTEIKEWEFLKLIEDYNNRPRTEPTP